MQLERLADLLTGGTHPIFGQDRDTYKVIRTICRAWRDAFDKNHQWHFKFDGSRTFGEHRWGRLMTCNWRAVTSLEITEHGAQFDTSLMIGLLMLKSLRVTGRCETGHTAVRLTRMWQASCKLLHSVSIRNGTACLDSFTTIIDTLSLYCLIWNR